MTTRILPPDEWPRLAGTEAERLWPLLNPRTARVVVVERQGEIVGCHVLMQMLHAECLWVHPEHRGKASVARRLWSGVQEVARGCGVHAIVTHAVDDTVRGLLAHVGAEPIVGEAYMVPVQSADDRRSIAVGRRFHTQLERQLTGENHPDDPAHDREVGRALRTAIEQGDVAGAVGGYNAWAARAGYVPIRVIDQSEGRWRIDMQTSVIDIDAGYGVTVVEERSTVCQ